MKLRHATALALVGWAVIVPPFQGLPSPFDTRAYLNAPLREWQLTPGSWSSATNCEQHVQRVVNSYLEAKRKKDRETIDRLAKESGFTGERKIFDAWMEQAYSHARCVPDGDPRLDGFVPIDSGS